MLTRLAALSLLASGALVAVPPFVGAASSADEVCQGRPATIVGVGPTVTGTPGPDVIVSGGAVRIDADAGDDLVCVTPGATERIVLHGDAGDDSILVEDGVDQVVRAELGAGADTYVGGEGVDVVTSTAGPIGADGFGPDDVSTGGGDDVFVAYAPVGRVDLGDDQDRLDLHQGDSGRLVSMGAGNDVIYLPRDGAGIVAPSATLDAGPGIDRIDLEVAARVDLRKGTLTLGQTTAALLGIQDAFLRGEDSTFIGDGGGNTVYAYTCASKVKGGRGRDRIAHLAPDIACDEDGPRHRWFGNQGDDVLSGSQIGRDELFGGPGDDTIDGNGMPNTMSGGGGDDLVVGGPEADRVFGGNGNDLIRGSRGPDTLFGGAGRDVADGGPGRDRCVAEVRRRTCER